MIKSTDLHGNYIECLKKKTFNKLMYLNKTLNIIVLLINFAHSNFNPFWGSKKHVVKIVQLCQGHYNIFKINMIRNII